MIWDVDELYLFLITIGLFLLAIELGFRLGKRYSDRKDGALSDHVSSLQSSVFGLLALLLGFTFAMSIERFDIRKQLVLEEANSVGTTYLRSQFLPEKLHQEAAILLQQYVESRLEFYYAGNDISKIELSEEKSANIEKKLWNIAVQATKKPKNPQAINLFIQSLNDIIDVNEKRRVALENHVPEPVVVLLFFVSIFGMGFIGYNYGLTGKRRHTSTAFFALLIASVLIIILDIDRPRSGLIQVSQASLERLQDDIGREQASATAPNI